LTTLQRKALLASIRTKYVKAKRNDTEKPVVEGLFVKLVPELQTTLIVAAKRGVSALRKYHDNAMKLQKDADSKRKQIEHEKSVKIQRSIIH
jgi:hypothetical protein